MRKNILLIISALLLVSIFGCTSNNNNVKVYENTEDIDTSHDEQSITAVITDIDLEDNIICFLNCKNGESNQFIYHGGVSVTNTYGDEIGIDNISNGSVVDVAYYSDTNKIVSIKLNSSVTILKKISKLSVDTQNLKATYKGTSCPVSEFIVAFDGSVPLNVMEINTEDQVTLYIYGGKLVSVVVDVGHGYVRLKNQDTYVGGMVEIGYDVIVPVTNDMLLAVREGKYTLRINKGSYSNTKQIEVTKDNETVVDLSDIAVPSGTVTFDINPAESDVYVNDKKIDGYTYNNSYGSYSVKVTAEGYKTFTGSFRISEPVKSFTINMTKLDEEDEKDSTDTTTENPNSTTDPNSTTGSDGTTESPDDTGSTDTKTGTSTDDGTDKPTTDSTSTSTETGETTDNTITIKTPVGVGVYLDGDYVGLAPVTFPKVVGTHTITLYKKGYLIKSYTIQATNNGKDDEHSFAALTSLLDIIE